MARRSGRTWTSVVATVLVTVDVLLWEPRRERRDALREWFGLWAAPPASTADAVHTMAFTAWLRLAYPLMAMVATAFWLLDERSAPSPEPWVFIGLLAFGLVSTAVHVVRATAVRPTVTRGSQVLAGWPFEVAVLAACLAGAKVAYLL